MRPASSCSVKVEGRQDYNQARNEAVEWLNDRGFVAEKETLGKFGSNKGQIIGMQTIDKKVGYRIEFDSRYGAHINVFAGKEKGVILFKGDQDTVNNIIKKLNR